MEIAISKEINPETLKNDLQLQFPHWEVKHAFMNKKMIRLVHGPCQVLVGPIKDRKFPCLGNLNMLNLKFFIPFVLLLSFFLIGGFVFLFIMTRKHRATYKQMEQEVRDFIQRKYA
ncbi:MAG: hypothetical protein OIF50_03240 [Flavobacteriaceae bacterium]|nr:hypothetical protein [Flavobacteriaceae bacterium]